MGAGDEHHRLERTRIGSRALPDLSQEVVDVFAEQTGGKNAPVRLPKDGQRLRSVRRSATSISRERIENPDGQTERSGSFLFQYKGKRTLIFENTGVPQ